MYNGNSTNANFICLWLSGATNPRPITLELCRLTITPQMRLIQLLEQCDGIAPYDIIKDVFMARNYQSASIFRVELSFLSSRRARVAH
jgi:hypothetical protein